MKGFKITNIDFHQAVTLPAGTYTYSCKARPVFSSITFRVGLTDYVISNLSPGVYQKGIKYTFTVESEQANFYPSRTVGDEIFEPQLEEGTKATTAGPNILDEPEALSRAGIQITTDMARIYAKKGDVDASISLEAGLIRQEISDTNHRVSTVEQTVDSWSSTITDEIEGRVSTVEQTVDSWSSTITDSGKIASQILQEDGTVKISAEQIELEGSETANGNFIVNVDGTIKAKDAEIEGSIATKSGNDKITLNDNNDNQLKFRHSNGTVAAMFGMSNGEPALIWYDPNGNETWRAGQNGIVYVEGLVIDGNCEYMSGGVEYDISFTNNASNTQTLTQVEFLIRYKDNDISQEVEELEPGETIVSLGGFSIASHQTINFVDHIVGVLPNIASRGGFIYLSYKNPANKYRYFNIAYS